MGLFDFFRKRKPAVPPEQLSYDVAYFILPHYAHERLDMLQDMVANAPGAAGPFFAVMAAQSRGVEPDIEFLKRFSWHTGQLADGREYWIQEFPTPAPLHLDLEKVRFEDMLSGKLKFTLAPYFSAILRSGDQVEYYVLGQSAAGGATLRCVTADGTNANLGPGPEPNLPAFLAALGDAGGREAIAAISG